MAEQFTRELAVARLRLRAVLDRTWDRDPRDHRRAGDDWRKDRLWRAARAVSELLDALDELACTPGAR